MEQICYNLNLVSGVNKAMIFYEYRNYLKSKINFLIILLLSIPVAISYYSTFRERNEWEQQLLHPGSDLNISKTQQLVDGYSGVSYLFNFLFSSDCFIIFFLIALLSFSCMFGAQLFTHRNNGFGNMIISRSNYRKYLRNMIVSQSLYVITFITGYFTLLLIITECIAPFKINNYITCNIPMSLNSVREICIYFCLQVLLLLLLLLGMLICTSLSNVVLSNRYIIHCVPLCLYFFPLLVSLSIGNISGVTGRITSLFVVDNNILSLYFHKVTDASIQNTIISYSCLPVFLFVIDVILYIINLKKYRETYQ